jgi:hypothetical protein
MINEALQSISESQPENKPFVSSEPVQGTPSVLPDTIPSQPAAQKKTGRKRWTIFSTVLLGLVCALSVVVIGVFFTLINIGQEKASIAKVLDAYMYAMKVKNPERAYEFFSPHATSQVPISRLQEWLAGRGYGMFEGYQSLTIDSFSLAYIIKREPNQPQGIVFIIKGSVLYDGKMHGNMDASLEKVNGEWKIYDVTIIVPKEKLK